MGGKTSYQSHKKYRDKAYDRVDLIVPKGQKQKLQDYAAKHGISLNALFNQAVQEKINMEETDMLTLAKMMEIINEKDETKRAELIAALPEAEKEKLFAEVEKLADEGKKIIDKYRVK